MHVGKSLYSGHFEDPRTIHLTNFHGVESKRIYRSARPTWRGLQDLKREKNVRTVISLEDDPAAIENERNMCRKLGLEFIPKQMNANSLQNHDYVMSIVRLLIDPQNQPVLVHCYEGKDRTGLIIALFRVLIQNSDKHTAYAEMEKYGFHHQPPLVGHFWWATREHF